MSQDFLVFRDGNQQDYLVAREGNYQAFSADYNGALFGGRLFGNQLGSGQLGGGMRRIKITGSAVLNTSLSSPEYAESFLRPLFEAQGWTIFNFDFARTGYWTVSFDINIEALVPDDYTNQNHVDQAALILSSYEVSYGVGSTRAITNLVLNSNGPDRADVMAGGNNTQAQSGNPGNSGGNSGKPDPDKNYLTEFWKGLERDLNVASSTLMIGGAVLLVYLMRR